MPSPEIEREIRSIKRTCRGPLPHLIRKRVGVMLKEGFRDEAARLDDASRLGCGYDFNTIILSNPLDGVRRGYVCPKCGVGGYYTPPKYE